MCVYIYVLLLLVLAIIIIIVIIYIYQLGTGGYTQKAKPVPIAKEIRKYVSLMKIYAEQKSKIVSLG